MADQNMNRPDIMDSLSETQLAQLENQFDQNDRNEFNTIAQSFGWDEQTCNQVWDWLSQGKRNEGFSGAER